jgi:hypothetical protein
MKRLIKKKQRLFDSKVVFIHDKNLDKLKAEEMAPEKLAEANRRLRNKKLPE